MDRLIIPFVLTLVTGLPLWAVDIVYVGSKAANPKSINDVSHSSWNALLARYVDGDGQVDYRSWKSSPDDLRLLDNYLSELSTGDPKLPASRESTLAYWINAYNAVTVKGILREYPTSSIRNHTARLWGYNIWKHLRLYASGKPYSLDQMEHDILRKMNEPRIHFAIVCASKGCPRLLNEAYQPENVDEQLEINAKDFFRRLRHFRFSPGERKFYLSSILDWFGSDFGSDQRAQLARIAPWLPSKNAKISAATNKVTVEYLDYDWTLNEQSTKPR